MRELDLPLAATSSRPDPLAALLALIGLAVCAFAGGLLAACVFATAVPAVAGTALAAAATFAAAHVDRRDSS